MEKLRADGIQGMLVAFRCKYFVFQLAIKKFKYEDTQYCNFAFRFVWV
jgi:hypothetical protein